MLRPILEDLQMMEGDIGGMEMDGQWPVRNRTHSVVLSASIIARKAQQLNKSVLNFGFGEI